MRITVACPWLGVPLLLISGAEAGETERPLVLAYYYIWYGAAHRACGSFAPWGEAAADRRCPPAIGDVSSCASPLIGPRGSMEPEVIGLLQARLGDAEGVDR